MKFTQKLLTVATVTALSATSSFATEITISEMNADISASLEGALSGTGTTGSSAFDIDTTPSTAQVTSTFADYTVTGLDLDGNASFTESFSFRITFSSPNDINFADTLETMGLTNDEDISLSQSFTLSVSILSDTSATHDVVFDGFTALDFVSMSGTDVSITSISGNTVVTLAGGDTALGAAYYNPTLTYANSGTTTNNGTFEDWTMQFSTVVPEPNAYAMLAGICALGFVILRRRRA